MTAPAQVGQDLKNKVQSVTAPAQVGRDFQDSVETGPCAEIDQLPSGWSIDQGVDEDPAATSGSQDCMNNGSPSGHHDAASVRRPSRSNYEKMYDGPSGPSLLNDEVMVNNTSPSGGLTQIHNAARGLEAEHDNPLILLKYTPMIKQIFLR